MALELGLCGYTATVNAPSIARHGIRYQASMSAQNIATTSTFVQSNGYFTTRPVVVENLYLAHPFFLSETLDFSEPLI